MSIFRRSRVVVVSQSNRNCDIGFRKILHTVYIIYSMCRRGVVVNALVAVNKVALRRPRLLGWVTVCRQTGKPFRYVTNHLGQLSLPSLRGRQIEYRHVWRVHLCLVAGNTV